MNHRERALAILNYQPYDRLPVVHFGYWDLTLEKWATEGHVTSRQARDWKDGNAVDVEVSTRLGFDFNWFNCFRPNTAFFPTFRKRVVRVLDDGSRHVLNRDAVIVLEKDGAYSIPPEVEHMLKGRKEWEAAFRRRLQFDERRIARAPVYLTGSDIRYEEGGKEILRAGNWDAPYGLFCGSLYGIIRNWVGLVNAAYMQADEPALFGEIIDTVGELCFQNAQAVLDAGIHFDFGHFWEDICYNHGPLVNPRFFRERIGPHYRRITDLLHRHGVSIVSLDCDGQIDALVPVWLDNGVNTMFPIEVGTWDASIQPWRAQYGRDLRGVGGVRKSIFAQDYAAVDAEVERLMPLVDLGGYIPCPDHRLSVDAKWENVQYYCEKTRRTFG